MLESENNLRDEILSLTREYVKIRHKAHRPAYESDSERQFVPGQTVVPYAGRIFTEEEVLAAVSASLDFWLTLGKEGKLFSEGLARYLGVRDIILTNSGSSANLLAITALTSHKLGERRLLQGDEVITTAAGFPTTVSPIVQNGLVPVFIDSDPQTGNALVDQLEKAFVIGKTKAVMMAHTLGNPFDLEAVSSFCQEHDLWLIEDNCDALGSLYDDKLTGAYGDLSTLSFYPPHHMTLGEGGAVCVRDSELLKICVESFRDWGRDCHCPSGKDNTCGKRFSLQLGDLPRGYDHKFTYSHLGYNLNMLDIQAAIGIEQLKKLPYFGKARIENWEYLRAGLKECEEFFHFMLPTHSLSWTEEGFLWDNSGHRTQPSWFGFMIRVHKEAPFSKFDLVRFLAEKKIGNRMLFGGNLVRQPAFVQLKKDKPEAFRIVGDLSGADICMNDAVFIGTYSGLTTKMLDYTIDTIGKFVKERCDTIRTA